MQSLVGRLSAIGSKRALLLAVGLVIICSLAAVSFGSGPTIINYRLTLQVKVDGVIHSGSSVIETRWSAPSYLAQSPRLGVKVHGQAVVVDLGQRGMLFALLGGPPTDVAGGQGSKYFPDEPADVLVRAFLHRDVWSVTSFDTLHEMASHNETVQLPPDDLPMLVRFTDINDPMTVKQVSPRDLSAGFGSGTEFVGATIAITDDPVTTGIEKTLPWLKRLNGTYLTGRTSSSMGLAGTLYGGNLQTGEN